ncbi:MAG: HupE/UreJ family protein [Alphaproteobacteria bacterium]|nr:HupE/UreJ family protein [Alphaproteobacteria bacterium]MCW5741703.1 HupE/UreJ family protein [Alphaproteobacteria bacterium]
MRFIALAAALLAVTASAAHAHTGHPLDSAGAGVLHPLTGLDHLLAMLGVGIWAAHIGATGERRATWLVPAPFVVVMVLGAIVGMSGASLPLAEAGIIGSVVLLGLLIAATPRMPLWAPMAVIALFAFCHGFAHGAEMPASSSALTYGAGFVAATIGLHLAGIGIGRLARRLSGALGMRVVGGAMALAGVALAAT